MRGSFANPASIDKRRRQLYPVVQQRTLDAQVMGERPQTDPEGLLS
jgi:hypothetical protein